MPARHVENYLFEGRRLGRRTPKNMPAIRLRGLLTGDVPAHPAAADHLGAVPVWGLYGNDRWGDCGPAAVANQRRLVTRCLTGAERAPTLQDVLDLYRRAGNPDFDPATGAGDNGVDLQTMLEAVHDGGIGGTPCVAFAKVDPANLDEVRAAIAIFGSLLVGVDLERAQQTQTDTGDWEHQPSPDWGGHAVLAGSYNSHTTGPDMSVVTWAKVVGASDDFWRNQVEEAWAVIWPEHLGAREFLDGVDQQALAADYLTLTDRPLPIPTPGPVHPTPVPAPSPNATAADHILRATLGDWPYKPHVGANKTAAEAIQEWIEAKGL